MILLGIDTATSTGGVGIVEANASSTRVLADDSRVAGRTHGARILEQMDAALEAAGLDLASVDAFAVANGPGSFTGLRVGMATAKSLAWSCGRPIVGVPTLEAWASRALGQKDQGDGAAGHAVAVVLDARKGEVYRAAFGADGAGLKRLLPEAVESPEACVTALTRLRGDASSLTLLGDGAKRYAESFAALRDVERISMDSLPPAGSAVAALAAPRALAGDFDDARRLAPAYVRASEAELSLARR
jgi:tRNA threonylcarbamoyladenosine biosynthesis protein TsaB